MTILEIFTIVYLLLILGMVVFEDEKLTNELRKENKNKMNRKQEFLYQINNCWIEHLQREKIKYHSDKKYVERLNHEIDVLERVKGLFGVIYQDE